MFLTKLFQLFFGLLGTEIWNENEFETVAVCYTYSLTLSSIFLCLSAFFSLFFKINTSESVFPTRSIVEANKQKNQFTILIVGDINFDFYCRSAN